MTDLDGYQVRIALRHWIIGVDRQGTGYRQSFASLLNGRCEINFRNDTDTVRLSCTLFVGHKKEHSHRHLLQRQAD